jgi:hypothetical protein
MANVACAVAFDWGVTLAQGPKCYWCKAKDIGRTDDEVKSHVANCALRYEVAVAS